MSPHEKALAFPAGEWFDVAQLTEGTPDYDCWDRLCKAAMAQYVRPGDYARLIMNETRSRFCWQPRVHPGEISLSTQLKARRRQSKP